MHSNLFSLSHAKFSHNFWGYSPNLESVVTVFGCVMANFQRCFSHCFTMDFLKIATTEMGDIGLCEKG